MGRILTITLLTTLAAVPGWPDDCVTCHKDVTPAIVGDWESSRHGKLGLSCAVCHGEAHKTAADVARAAIPTPETCAKCHPKRVEEFKAGKHAFAWAAMKAMPTTHWQPMVLTEGMKGCGGCHKIGLKTAEELAALKKEGAGFGVASCDACHTRHLFSVEEARSPQACMTCHMGFDHPQWEMYSTSKHGARYLLKQTKLISDTAAAPSCYTCHMDGGNHAVKTAWGFLAVRLPLPEDKEWADDRVTILKALGVLDPAGNPTPRLDVVKAADVARLTAEDWQTQRDKMIGVCGKCHSENFARGELAKGDDIIRSCDKLMAEAIDVVVTLYRDGILKPPANYPSAYPDLLAFHDAPTAIEQKLFVMFLEHRMRAFQGTFHANPDYALWYGWSEMVRDLTEIKEMAAAMRAEHARRGK